MKNATIKLFHLNYAAVVFMLLQLYVSRETFQVHKKGDSFVQGGIKEEKIGSNTEGFFNLLNITIWKIWLYN